MSNEVLENIKSRRSVRTYTEQQVSAGDLNLILEAAAYAPSGMNFQTWHFTAIQDAAVLTELNEKIKGAFAKSDDPHLQERGHSETYCCYYHAPTLVIVSNEPTRWWASMDCACALQNIFLAAKSLGIGSCWINQLGQTRACFPHPPRHPRKSPCVRLCRLGLCPCGRSRERKEAGGRHGDRNPLTVHVSCIGGEPVYIPARMYHTATRWQPDPASTKK